MIQPSQPKITRKLVKRTIIAAILIVLIIPAYIWIAMNRKGLDLGSFDSAGDIAAIQMTDDGAQVVIIKPDGTVIPSPDYKAGQTDRNVVWKPDGNRIFFESDRYNQEPHVFRWSPERKEVDRR